MRPVRTSIAIGLLVAAVIVLAACSGGHDSVLQSGKGGIRLVMTSSAGASTPGSFSSGKVASTARPTGPGGTTLSPTHDDGNPLQMLQAANVTFSSIVARNLDGQLIDVTIALPVTVDLLSLDGGGTFTLPVGFLPPGTYDQLVVVMTAVELTLTDGAKITIEPPGGGFTAIVSVTVPFTVVEGQTTTVTIRFRPDLSFANMGEHWGFHPAFECGGHHDGDHD